MTSRQVVRFGSRGSALARAQTDLVMKRFHEFHPDIRCEVVVIQTEGDRDKETPLTVIGGRGVFTNALQDALRRGEIDVAVHSAKDLPTDEVPDLKIAAFLERADPRDVFISRHGVPMAELGPNPVIGTSSRRRQVQVLKLRPDAQLVDLRGNIDTRLRKAFETDLDGIVLAAAGIERMGWSDQITEYLPTNIAVPSPGQGALAIEVRANDDSTASRMAQLNDREVSIEVETERAFLRAMGGGCTSPVGAHADLLAKDVLLHAMVGSVDGSRVLWLEEIIPILAANSRAESRSRQMLAQLENPSSLEDRRILVSTNGGSESLIDDIRARGALTLVIPVTRIELVGQGTFESELHELGDQPFDWIVFTSKNAVAGFFRSRLAFSIANRASIAVVGPSTRLELERLNVDAALQPEKSSAEGLVEQMGQHNLAGKRILFPHGNLARKTLPEGLRTLGAKVETIEVYRTLERGTIRPSQLRSLKRSPTDAAIFCSPSSVHSLIKGLGEISYLLNDMVIACIGPTTAEAAVVAGLKVGVVPARSTYADLIDALERYFDQQAEVECVPVGVARSGEGEQLV